MTRRFIEAAAEEAGWNVTFGQKERSLYNRGKSYRKWYVCFTTDTACNQDVFYEYEVKSLRDIPDQVYETWQGYDPEEEAMLWFKGRGAPGLRDLLNDMDELFVPMEHCVPFDHKNEDGTWHLSNPAWAQEVFHIDLNGLKNADRVIAMYTGHRSTTGTAWELGYAHALGIPITLYIPAWAKKNDFSLMVLNAASNYMDETGEIHPVSFSWLNQFNQK